MEILASLDDINANLPSQTDPGGLSNAVIEADAVNTGLLQVSIARVVRGYLSQIASSAVLMSWDSPDNTPDIIREVAGKLIAAGVYFNSASRTSLAMEERSFAQLKYDEAMAILNKIISGEISLGLESTVSNTSLNELDYFPVDDTDRAFTVGMLL